MLHRNLFSQKGYMPSLPLLMQGPVELWVTRLRLCATCGGWAGDGFEPPDRALIQRVLYH
jgi:hypothetical protein